MLLLHKFCSKRRYIWVENGETLRLTKNGKTITCTMDNSVLLVVSRLSSYSSSILSTTSRSKDQSNHTRKSRTLSDPVTTRSGKHACGKPMLTDHGKQTTGNREPADEMNKEDPTQSILVWLQPFTVNPEDQRRMCSHMPLKERTHRFGTWCFQSGDTKTEAQYSCLLPQKPKEIYSANGKVWWFDNRRAQIPQRRTWISEQSPTRCRGTSFLATQWNPCHTKSSQETEKNLRKVTEPSQKPKVIHTYDL